MEKEIIRLNIEFWILQGWVTLLKIMYTHTHTHTHTIF